MSKSVKTIIIVVVVIILAFIAYSYFFVGDTQEPLESTGSQAAGEVGQELLALLVSIRSVNLNAEIFSVPAFQSLVDFSVEIEEQELGRRNPFAPIGVGNISGLGEDLEEVDDSEEENTDSATTTPEQ